MEPEEVQLPPNSNPNTSSLTVEDVQNVQVPGYKDASEGDIIAQNQQQANIVGAQPDPYSQAVIDSYNAQFTPDAIGPQGSAALYPGMALPEQMGTYSGSIIGSNTLFAPGGNVTPVDPVLARRKAIEDAAKKRASSLAPFEAPKPFQLKDQAFQKSFNDAFFNFHNNAVKNAKEDYKQDFGIVLKDPSTKEGGEYIQGMANFEYMQKNFDQITADIAAMEEALQDGTLNFTDEGLKAFNEYTQLLGDFGEGDIWRTKDLGKLRRDLQGFVSLEYKINDGNFLKNIMSEQTAWASNPNDAGEYYLMREGTKKSYDEAIQQVATQMEQDADIRQAMRRGAYTRDDLVKSLKSRLKNQVTSEASMQQKSKANLDASFTQEISPEGQTLDGARKDNNYTYNEDGTLNTSVAAKPGKVFFRWDMNLTGGNKEISWKDGEGDPKTLNVKGIKLTQPTMLNGSEKQQMEGDVVSTFSGFSVVDRGNGPQIIANSSSYVTTKQRYNNKGERIPYDKWKGGDFPEARTEVEYREIQTPVLLIDENGKETGSIEEIINQTDGKENKALLRKAYESAMKEHKKAIVSGPSGAAGDVIFE